MKARVLTFLENDARPHFIYILTSSWKSWVFIPKWKWPCDVLRSNRKVTLSMFSNPTLTRYSSFFSKMVGAVAWEAEGASCLRLWTGASQAPPPNLPDSCLLLHSQDNTWLWNSVSMRCKECSWFRKGQVVIIRSDIYGVLTRCQAVFSDIHTEELTT